MIFFYMIDLHVHTTASDGQYSPSQIVTMAKEKNIEMIAITDHDTVGGLSEAEKTAAELGILLIPGVELNINWPTGEFHLLGLGLKKISPAMTDHLNKLQHDRLTRNERMMQKMQELGYDVSMEEMLKDLGDTVVGRPHLAQYFVKKGIVKRPQLAFDKFIGKGRPAYIERSGLNLDEAIVAITESGGHPVLAHPMSLYLSWGKIPETVIDLRDRGIEGLEAFHPGARTTDCLRLKELAENLDMKVTGGSDFHGEKVRSDRHLGHTCGDKKINDYLVKCDELKEWLTH